MRQVQRLLFSLLAGMLLSCLFAAPGVQAQTPAPEDVFGFEPGADYKMADYEQVMTYYRQLSKASDRVRLRNIGTTVLGRSMPLLIISSDENLKNVDRWREISETLARARIGENEARELSTKGKAVVWIDAGMHSTERVHAQMAPELAHRVATEASTEMEKIREKVIFLLMPLMNPDGLDIVENWYDRVLDTPYETTGPPWLYHHYVGHDNNRDWFMNNMPETRAVTDVLYSEWYPQIVLNHHQTGPDWSRIFVPPFSEPVNPDIHPGVVTGVNQVGTAMTHRFAMKEMPGVVANNTYTMFWNGGMRTAPYFHNQIGLLTEVSHSTPTPRYYEPDSLPDFIGNQKATDGTALFYPDPWEGGESHFRDALDYAITASMGVLDLAADRPQQFLMNIYQMGRDEIEEGESGDPYAFVIPPEQWHPGEAHNLVNILRQGGVEVDRATGSFQAGEETYPAGSFVVPTAQAFRPYVMDLLEPQEYPNRLQYPDGPPDPPYDLAGWTLPMQMGVTVDRVDDPFDAPTTAVTDSVAPAPGDVEGPGGYGYALSHRPNTSVKAVNQLLTNGAEVDWASESFSAAGETHPAGTIVVEGASDQVETLAEDLGLTFTGLDQAPSVDLHALDAPTVGLYKSWDASMDEGWTRWLFNKYKVPHDTLHNTDVRSQDLSQYDVIVMPHQSADEIMNGHAAGTMPSEYVGGVGTDGTAALEQYVQEGGCIVAFDGATSYAVQQFGLPVEDVTDGLSDTEFFIPGSLIRTSINTEHPLAYGMQEEVAASFQQSRAFVPVRQDYMGEGGQEDIERAPAPPVEVVARYAEDDLLMSGWALGENEHIGGEIAVANVRHGDGSVVLFGFRPQFRGQPRATYKLVFNAIHGATTEGLPQIGNVSPVSSEDTATDEE
jgi:glutamine amidotransferase-like uncharacterized protein